MKKYFLWLIVLVLTASPLAALRSVTIKLASPLPEGTEWDLALRRMADDWREISGGRVRVKIYPGGIAGNEADMIRKMRFGQLDAGVFTAFGLKSMVPETFVITLPGMLRNNTELDYVLEHWVERFDERFREEGFEMMAWSKTGWAYFFSEDPLHVPADLRRKTLTVDDTETEIAAGFKALGFQVVPVSLGEITVSLQSGLADSFYAPPVAAAGFQWFALAPYMTEYRLAPVIAGLVLSQRAWSRIPEEYHSELKASMADVARRFYDESLRLNEEALKIMDENGLKRVPVSDNEITQWMTVMMSGHKLMVGDGKAIPVAVYDALLSELESLRSR